MIARRGKAFSTSKPVHPRLAESSQPLLGVAEASTMSTQEAALLISLAAGRLLHESTRGTRESSLWSAWIDLSAQRIDGMSATWAAVRAERYEDLGYVAQAMKRLREHLPEAWREVVSQ